jgi:hypothetical protein
MQDHPNTLTRPTTPTPGPLPARTGDDGDAVQALAEVARAAPRVWAWWPAAGGPLRVSGRPPADGHATHSAEVVATLLQRQHPEAAAAELRATLRRAQRADGSLPSPVLLRVLQRLRPPH